MEIFLNPKFLISLVLVLGLLYLFFTLKVEKEVLNSNNNAIRIHSNTYNAAQGLYELVEKEMKIKVANQIAFEKSEKIIELESHIKELEERKENLLEQIGELEKGEIYRLVEEIELTKIKLDNVWLHIGQRLNPVINWIERDKEGDIQKAQRHFNQVKQEEEPEIKKIDKKTQEIKKMTKRLNI